MKVDKVDKPYMPTELTINDEGPRGGVAGGTAVGDSWQAFSEAGTSLGPDNPTGITTVTPAVAALPVITTVTKVMSSCSGQWSQGNGFVHRHFNYVVYDS